MAKLIYSATTSLDGYTADGDGKIDWSAPDDEVFAFANDLLRGIGTLLFGRRMYETMLYWETFEAGEDEPQGVWDFLEIWRAADKVVYSRTLDAVSSVRTRIERNFDPEAVLQMLEAADLDISVGGAELAGQAMAAGLVDELHLFVTPVTLGGGTPALPTHFCAKHELLDVDRFASGVVHLRYRTGD